MAVVSSLQTSASHLVIHVPLHVCVHSFTFDEQVMVHWLSPQFCILAHLMSNSSRTCYESLGGGGGGRSTHSYGLYGDVPLDGVWFLFPPALSRVYNLKLVWPNQGLTANQGVAARLSSSI